MVGTRTADTGRDEDILAEIQDIFGSLPRVFERMAEAGELQQHWPSIYAVLVEPAPLSPVVVQALFRLYSLRCAASYCFVLHSLTLSSLLGWPASKRVSLAELGRVFELPNSEPDHDRWSRILRLAWLAEGEGPHRAAADFLLRELCSADEHAQIHAVYRANRAINRFTLEPPLALDGEPMLDTFPPELRALVPDFVQFHMREHGSDVERPVSSMCSVCRKVRATDGQWWAYASIVELLADDVLFSHGLCPSCLEAEGVPPELLRD